MAGENQNGSTIGINTKVVNQNDLLKIINASATTMKNVYNSIIALADACSFLKNMNVRRVKNELNKMIQLIPYIKQFVLEINSQFKRLEGNIKNSIDEGCELIKSIGTFTKNIYSILDIIKLDKLPNPAVYRFKMYIIVKVYISIIHQFVKDLVTSFENIGTKFDKLGEHPDKIISNIDKLIKCVTSILNSVNSIKISSLLLIDLKLVLTYISFVKLGLLISAVSLTTPFISSANKVLKWMSENMQYLLQPIQLLSKISIFSLIWVRWKLRIIEYAWVKLSSLIVGIQAVKIGNTQSIKNKVDIIKTVLGVLRKIFLSAILVAPIALLAIPALAIITLGASALTLSLRGIQLLLKIVGERKTIGEDVLKLLNIKLLFATLGHVFLLTILVAPMALLAIPALAIVTLGTAALTLSLRGIQLLLKTIGNRKIIREDVLKLLNIKLLFTTLGHIFLSAILVAPAALLAIPALAIVALGIVTLTLSLRGIQLLLKTIGKRKTIRDDVLKLLTIGLLFTTLGLVFLSTILVAPTALLAIPALAIVTLGAAALTLSLRGIQLLLKIVGKRKAMRKDILKLLTIGLLFATLGHVFLLTILVAPIAAIASLALIVITLATGIMALCLWGIAWMLSKIPWLKLFIGLFFMNIAMMLIVGLALGLLIVALAATFVKDKILDILILMGGIIMVVVIMGLLGFCVGSFLLPFMIPIIIGLIAMMTIVGLVMLMALALFALSLITLDKDAIINNVKVVLSTAREIIKMLYSEEEEEPNKVDEPWYEALFNFIGGSVAKIASAIMSIYILAATIVSVLCILLIAAGLWLLQHITLDPVKITSNVTTVIETANNIIKLVFESEDKEATPSNQGVLKSLLGYIDPKLGKIVDSIFAMSFLAVSLISIMIIGFIATNLRTLQTIDLDATTISSNVTTVVDTANAIINNAFKEDTTTNKPTKKGFLSKIIGAISPGLAKMGDAINAVGFLAVSLGAIALISVIAKELQSINNINISKEAISAKVDIIIKSVEEIIKKVFEKGDDGEWVIGGTKYDVGDVADDMHDMFGDWPDAIKSMYNLAGWLQKIVKINTTGLGGKGSMFAKNIDALTLSVQYMITTLNSKQFQEVSKKNNLNNVSDLADYFTDLKESLSYSNQEINNSGKMFAETVKFIDKINGMDMQKLKTAENLFKNLADLSNNIRGNFQGLAEALNEDIAPLLEKLNATIEKANKQTGDSLGRIENYYSAMSGTNPDDIVMTDDNGQPLNEEQKEKVVKQNARNTANQLYSNYQKDYKNNNEINKSLVELTSLMRGIDRLIAILDPNLGPTPLRVRNIP